MLSPTDANVIAVRLMRHTVVWTFQTARVSSKVPCHTQAVATEEGLSSESTSTSCIE